MAVYIDVDDIRQHVPATRGQSTELIEEIMDEQEYYVQTRLGLPYLPPDNPALKNVIRDLSIAAIIYAMLPVTSDNITKADLMRREALRKLRELEAGGLGVIGGVSRGNPLNDVYNPYDVPFFSASDFEA